MIRPTLRTLAFLSRLPPVSWAFGSGGPHPLGGDAAAFPLAGLVLALPAAGLLLVLDLAGLSPLTGAAGAVALLVALTGALHEDGLADTADGLGGHRAAAEALAIMKDSRIGAYGTLALALALLLRVALLAELAAHGAVVAALAILAAAAASRGAMALLWSLLPSADPGGLADRMGRPSRRHGAASALIGAALLALAAVASGLPAAAPVAIGLTAATLLPFARMLRRRLGGQTGDTLGAAQQIAEIAGLVGFALGAASL